MTSWSLQGQAQAYQGGHISNEGLVDKRRNVPERIYKLPVKDR